MTFELLPAGQVVIAGLELEVHEVGLGDEAGLGAADSAATHLQAVSADRQLVLLRLVALTPGLAFLFALDPVVLVLPPRGLGNRDTVEPHRAADVHAVARVPGELALHPVEGCAGRAEHLERFGFVEHVLVEQHAIGVSTREHLLHKGVETAGRCCWS